MHFFRVFKIRPWTRREHFFQRSAPFQHREHSVMTRKATARNVALPINRQQPNETRCKVSEILFHLQQNRIVEQCAADFYCYLWRVRKRLDCFVASDRQSFLNNTSKGSAPTRQWHLHVLSSPYHQHHQSKFFPLSVYILIFHCSTLRTFGVTGIHLYPFIRRPMLNM